MDYKSVLQNLIDNKDKLKKDYGSTQYNRAVDYFTLKTSHEPFDSIQSDTMRIVDDLFTNHDKLKGYKGYDDAYAQYFDQAVSETEGLYSTRESLSASRPSANTLNQYGIQYAYSNTPEDQIAKLAGVAPASFDINQYLKDLPTPAAGYQYDTNTAEGIDAILAAWSDRKAKQEALLSNAGNPSNPSAQFYNQYVTTDPREINGTVGAAVRMEQGIITPSQEKNKAITAAIQDAYTTWAQKNSYTGTEVPQEFLTSQEYQTAYQDTGLMLKDAKAILSSIYGEAEADQKAQEYIDWRRDSGRNGTDIANEDDLYNFYQFELWKEDMGRGRTDEETRAMYEKQISDAPYESYIADSEENKAQATDAAISYINDFISGYNSDEATMDMARIIAQRFGTGGNASEWNVLSAGYYIPAESELGKALISEGYSAETTPDGGSGVKFDSNSYRAAAKYLYGKLYDNINGVQAVSDDAWLTPDQLAERLTLGLWKPRSAEGPELSAEEQAFLSDVEKLVFSQQTRDALRLEESGAETSTFNDIMAINNAALFKPVLDIFGGSRMSEDITRDAYQMLPYTPGYFEGAEEIAGATASVTAMARDFLIGKGLSAAVEGLNLLTGTAVSYDAAMLSNQALNYTGAIGKIAPNDLLRGMLASQFNESLQKYSRNNSTVDSIVPAVVEALGMTYIEGLSGIGAASGEAVAAGIGKASKNVLQRVFRGFFGLAKTGAEEITEEALQAILQGGLESANTGKKFTETGEIQQFSPENIKSTAATIALATTLFYIAGIPVEISNGNIQNRAQALLNEYAKIADEPVELNERLGIETVALANELAATGDTTAKLLGERLASFWADYTKLTPEQQVGKSLNTFQQRYQSEIPRAAQTNIDNFFENYLETKNGEIAVPELPSENIFTRPDTQQAQIKNTVQDTQQQNVRQTAVSLSEKFAGTEYGDILVSEVEQGKYNYTPESAVPKLEKAITNIESGTVTYNDYSSIYNRGSEQIKNYTAQDVANMIALIDKANAEGNVEARNQLTAALVEAGTELGRAVQAYSLIKTASPEAHLAGIQREIERFNATNRAKFNNWEDVSLTEEEKQSILSGQTYEERNAAYKNAIARMQQNLPSTLWSKFDQFRKTAMLLNLKTQARNVAGNAALMSMNAIARKIEAGIQHVLLKPENRTEAVFTSAKYREMAKGDFENVQAVYKNQGRYNIEAKLGQGYLNAFRNEGIGKLLNNASNAVGWMLDTGDVVFGKHHYETALASFMQARGLNTITGEARAYALNSALEATFRSESKIADVINNYIKKGGIGGKAVSFVMPFVKTPINIAKEAASYSPLGLGKSIIADTIRLKAGKIDAATYIHNLAKGLAGTAVTALGFLLAKGWLIPGVKLIGAPPEDEEEKSFLKSQGWQPYSLQIGDTYIPISWAQPVATTMLMGATIADMTETGEGDVNDLLGVADTMINSIMEVSPMQGVKDILTYNESPSDVVTDILADLGTQFIPAISKQIVQTIDPAKYDLTGQGPLERLKNTALKGTGIDYLLSLAGVDTDIAQQVDAWGQPITQTNNFAARAALNTLSPANVTTAQENEVNAELDRLFESTGNNLIFPKTLNTRTLDTSDVLEIAGEAIRLSAKDLQELKEGIGQASYAAVSAYINSAQYQTDDDQTRAKTISGMYNDIATLYRQAKAYGVDIPGVTKSVSSQAEAYFNGEGASPIPDAKILAGDYLSNVSPEIKDMLTGLYDETGNNIFLLDDESFKKGGETYDYPEDIQDIVVEGYTPQYGDNAGEEIDGISDIINSAFFKQEDEAAQEQIIRDAINSIMGAVEYDTVRTENPLAAATEAIKPDTDTYYGFNDYWKRYGTDDDVIMALDEWGVYPKDSQSFSDKDLLEGSHDWTDSEQQQITETTYTALLKYQNRLDALAAQKIIDRVYLGFKNAVINGRINTTDILNGVYKYMDETYEW